MKILLIRHHFKASVNGKYEEPKFRFPPIGLAYIAATLREHGYIVEILDSYALNLDVSETSKRIEASQADIVGITCMTQMLNGVKEAARLAREALPHALIVLGGPHLSVNPKETMQYAYFDVGVIGEGEATILDLVQRFEKGEALTHVFGCAVRTQNGVRINPPRKRIQNINEIPFPARDLLPNHLYETTGAEKPFTYMLTSRGCPFRCAFCDKGMWGNHCTFRDPQNILDEMQWCVDHLKVKEIYIYDETFTVNKRRVLDICNRLQDRKFTFRWVVSSRVDTVDREMLEALKRAGCRQIRFGVESGNQQILDAMEKGITLSQIRTAFNTCREIGLQTFAYFMIGYPGESVRTIKETIRFAKEINPDWVVFTIAMALPGTALYQTARQQGYLKDYEQDMASDIVAPKEPYCITEELSECELKYWVKKAYRIFYLRPGYIMHRLVGITSLDQMKRYLNAFFRDFPLLIFKRQYKNIE